ncbi:PTS lactose transporter subunit IIC [Corynebacterium poyangense]|uniref:PTS lactose transporter subunit IIC n=1 Tax=Corynebacterium poyangense TaxID=2684405 RepID=A0A7H0SPA4_9CORY|nr:fructose-specific PTS transporter subunit EIIC [Corynebacterium poyangense]MBZ8177953.1 PTS transporter subunit EIIA [Corynebacterium poyangense]QNQ90379.1 PTS lactose transporter subunit IIC [Corynebacterium poyangense]
MNADLITPELVVLDQSLGDTPADVITALAALVTRAGRSTSTEQLAQDAQARENKSPTGVPGGVAIPHCRSRAVTQATLACARLSHKVDFSGPDGPANLVFLIAAPEGAGKDHLRILSSLARALVRKDFLATLNQAPTSEEFVQSIKEVLNRPKKTADATKASSAQASELNTKNEAITRIVAVTACPTGIAHTYMAADSLTQTAQGRNDVELHVETQGSSAVTPLEPAVISAADAVIFATDVGVKDRARFAGKPVISSGVKRAINEPDRMIDEAIHAARTPGAPIVQAQGDGHQSETSDTESAVAEKQSWGRRIQQAVMTGVSYMIPFVAAGGLLLALGFLVGGSDMANAWKALATGFSPTNLPSHTIVSDGETFTFERSGWLLYLGALLFASGQMAMQFIVPALSGYIAYALAGRPGIAPGFVGGALSVLLGAGFIGGLVTGIIAGLIAMWIGSWKVPRVISSLMPVVIIPLLSSLSVGLLMFLLLGRPLSMAMDGMQNWLTSMSGSSAAILGIILGMMMCFDLGGPVNKAAYLFATAGLSTGDEASLKIMAAVMTAGMVPPIALSIATFVRKSLFTPAEQENGKSAWLLGLSFVSEGAIPFAAADPLRVIPAMMTGGAVTGALSMMLGVGTQSPHGGIFVILVIQPQWAFLVALAAGILVSTLTVIALKQFWPSKANRLGASNHETA